MKKIIVMVAVLAFGNATAQITVTKKDTVCEEVETTYVKVTMLTGEKTTGEMKQINGYRKKTPENPYFITLNSGSQGRNMSADTEEFYDMNFKKLPKNIIVWIFKEL